MSAPPRLDAARAADLAADLAPFTVAAVEEALGPMAAQALIREQLLPARRALAGRGDAVSVLTGLFMLAEPVTAAELDAALPRTTHDAAVRAGLVEPRGRRPQAVLHPLVDLRPYAADDGQWWLACDLGEAATGGPLPEDHVLGVGGASTTLAQWTVRTPVQTALDLGTGCGVQAFHAARHASSVVATDVSGRALEFAAFNARLNASADG